MSQTSLTTPGAATRSLHAVDPASLSRMSMTELDELFAELEPALLAELQGHKRGHVLAVAGLDWLPAALRRALFELGPWRGKSFEGEFGANTWLLSSQRLEFARYLVREGPALDGSGKVIRLDYDVAANPKALRGVVGELRYLGPGLFLARMQVRWRGRAARVLYFTLES
jgi:hypothetical protein